MKYLIDLSKLQNEADIDEIEYYCKRYGTPLQAEYEEIKGLIEDKRLSTLQILGDCGYCHGLKVSTEILDQRIKEIDNE